MAFDNLILYVATYTDESDARTDYEALHDAQRSNDLMVVSAVVLSRDGDGEVTSTNTAPARWRRAASVAVWSASRWACSHHHRCCWPPQLALASERASGP